MRKILYQKVAQKFNQETAAKKAKDLELREWYGYVGMDVSWVANLEAGLKEINWKVKVVAEKYSISPCCLS